MKNIVCFLFVLSLLSQSFSQDHVDSLKIYKLDEFVLKAIRVSDNSPVAHEDFLKEDLEKINHGVDLPILLDQATSIVTTSDAGAGVGYTGIRVRGSDATRVNVTINGIPLNDSESQGTFWVDLPDLSSSTNNIQIQRGVGTSTNGAGAFGASINLSTFNTENSSSPYGEISNSFGSFNTQKNTIKLGTGLIDGKWNFEGRLSRVVSDGFVDRASADLSSYYLSGSFFGSKTTLRAIAFSGHETTYQAWHGAPLRLLDAGVDSNQSYNPYEYDNEVDDYTQSHYQLHMSHKLNNNIKLNAALHYTRGVGYYEQYKGIGQNALINSYSQESFSDYGLDNVISANGDTITQTDLIRRRWLDNHFYGLVYSAEYSTKKLQLAIGGGANSYLGRHFGEVIWAQYASNGAIRHPYYDNDGNKNDVNVYAKINYELKTGFDLYVDLQERLISYDFLGYDNNLNNVEQTASLAFFNPKAGFNYKLNETSKVYAFAGIGNKEPNRDDFTNSTPNSRPEHESMLDIELGYGLATNKLAFNVNLYNMAYKNQLIVTGQLNDVGAAVRVNVADSYRRGVEFSGNVELLEKLSWKFNATLSDNKIASFHEYVDDWDTGDKVDSVYSNTNIAFSPSIIASSQLVYQLFSSAKKGTLEMAFVTKYVGKQFIDNTSSQYSVLDAYLVNDLRMSYSIKNKLFKEIVLSTWVRNLFNQNYISNAWIYRFKSDGYNPVPDDIYANAEGEGTGNYNQIGAFNQAGINFFVGLTLKF